MRPALVLVLAALFALLPACVRTPEQICQEYEDAMNAMLDRCEVPIDFRVIDHAGGLGCEGVSQIDEPGDILGECIPWTRSVSCAEVDDRVTLGPSPSLDLPTSCASTHFRE